VPSTTPGPGLYLHLPFCAHACHYCDYTAFAGLDTWIPRYLAAVEAELAATAEAGPSALAPAGAATGLASAGGADGLAPAGAAAGVGWPTFATVFVGGGTPTWIGPAALTRLLAKLRAALPVDPRAEVTVEANPEDLDLAGLAELAASGVTRLSVGVRSTAERVLDFLGRRHAPADGPRAIAEAKAVGIASVNAELVYGAPPETAGDWAETLDAVVEAGADHVAASALTCEPGTAYAARVRSATLPAPLEGVGADRLAAADRRLGAAGLPRYEVSSWAGPGRRCRHLEDVWRGGDYLGLGAGAHGHWGGRRRWGVADPRAYAEAALQTGMTTAGAELLDGEARRAERLVFGLRLADGVARDVVEPVDEEAAAALVGAGLLGDDGARLWPTRAGLAAADELAARLLSGP
jgi:oxygen-independent coproporphyrinogen-3 oxidase